MKISKKLQSHRSINQIHFLTSYACLKKFFSVYDKNNDIYVIFNYDLYRFIKKYISNNSNNVFYFKNGKNHNIIFYRFKYLRFIQLLNEISNNDTKLYFYSNLYFTSAFYMIHKLSKNLKVFYLDEDVLLDYSFKYTFKNFLISSYLNLIYLLSRMRLKVLNHGDSSVILFQHSFSVDIRDELSWSEIKKKISITTIENQASADQKRVLYINQDLSTRSYINSKITYNNLSFILNTYRNKGYDIHAKNHPLHNKMTFYNFDYLIDSIIPIEIIDDSYDIYLTFFSLGIRRFPINKSFLLTNIIEFSDRSKAVSMLKFRSDNLSDYDDFNEKT